MRHCTHFQMQHIHDSQTEIYPIHAVITLSMSCRSVRDTFGHTLLSECCHSFGDQGTSFSFKVQSLDVNIDRMAGQARDDAHCGLCSLVCSLAPGVVHGLTALAICMAHTSAISTVAETTDSTNTIVSKLKNAAGVQCSSGCIVNRYMTHRLNEALHSKVDVVGSLCLSLTACFDLGP